MNPSRFQGRAVARSVGLLSLLLAAIGSGCAGAGPAPRYPIRDANRLRAVMQAREARIPSLRASGSADQFGRQGRIRGNIVVFVRRPNRLRVDAFAFGNLISSAVSDGTGFAMLQGRQYAVGPASACVTAQLLGIAMEPEQVVAVLSGGAPLIGPQMSAPRWEDGAYVVDVPGANGARERIEFELPSEQRALAAEQQTPRVRRVQLSDRQGLRADVTYRSYRDINGVPFPDRVRVVMPRDHLDTELRFDQVQPNFVIPPDPDDPDSPAPDPFVLQQPAGTQRVPIGC